MPPPQRSEICPGLRVQIIEKQNQRTGALSVGTVARILTKSPTHPHGIKVMLEDGKVTNLVAKDILAEIIDTNHDPEVIVNEKGLACLSGKEELIALIRKALEENPKPAEDYLSGKKEALMFLVGQVMKKTKGKANPKMLKELFQEQLRK